MADLYGETNDGYCGANPGSWAGVRDSAGSSFDSNNQFDTNAVSVTYYSGRGTYAIRRAFF